MYRLGAYIPGNSVLHRMDPRVKICSLVLLSIMTLQGDLLTEAILSAFTLLLIGISGLAPANIHRALRPAAFLLLLLFFLHLFLTQGTPVLSFGPMRITREGLERGGLVAWQFSLLLVSASLLTFTTSATEFVYGMEKLLKPLNLLGLPSHDAAFMLSLALRFLPTLLEEIQRMREARISRGAEFGAGPLHRRAKLSSLLVISLIMNMTRRADELAEAMESRGFQRGPRTYLTELRMGRADYLASAVILFISGICILRIHTFIP
jgi:energy-coupling factor transporter transmembrane protein EcfT